MKIVRQMSKIEFENLKKGDKVYISSSFYCGKVDGTIGKFIRHFNPKEKTLAVIENPQWNPKRLTFRVEDLGILISIGD